MVDSENRRAAGYGTYGGYDIALVKIKTKFDRSYGMKVCLPSPTLNDVKKDSVMVGYGKYHRAGPKGVSKCLTSDEGPMKYHYCDEADSCNPGPPPMSQQCSDFFSSPDTPNTVPEDLNELIVMLQPNNFSSLIYCFRNTTNLLHNGNPGGWCRVSENNYGHWNTTKPKEGMDWGFCSEECYLDKLGSGMLRKTTVDILPLPLCDKFLKSSVEQGVEVYPRILCAGTFEQLKYSIWVNSTHGFKELDANTENRFEKESGHIAHAWEGVEGYIHSPGTCLGDSGAPVLNKQTSGRYVITGVVSGGRGKLRSCGGVNNPTHITRIKMFSSWLIKLVGYKDVCWDDVFQARLNSITKKV